MKKFLPIGSIILLQNSTKRVMIVGVKQAQADGTVWDYSGCFYPEGVTDSSSLLIFNTEQIETLFFIGFQDGEGLSFLGALNDAESGGSAYQQKPAGYAPYPQAAAMPPPQAAATAPPPPPPPQAAAGANNCPRCGNQLDGRAVFCVYCGQRFQ